MPTYFSEFFEIDEGLLDNEGLLDISLINDLPVFIDPFLIFNSDDPIHKRLHESIIDYVRFLRDKAVAGGFSNGDLRNWFCFKEVRQNWLGFSKSGNSGTGLGMGFARTFSANVDKIFSDIGEEKISSGTHVEKASLISGGVGKDHVSDFTVNLTKSYFCELTRDFSKKYIDEKYLREHAVAHAEFNYQTESWVSRRYLLPTFAGDFVLLTPKELLTREENWINRTDLIREFEAIPPTISDEQLRSNISNYFYKKLARNDDKEPTQTERDEAAVHTIMQFPEVIDFFIRLKERTGDDAQKISSERIRLTEMLFRYQLSNLQRDLADQSEFYRIEASTYNETMRRLLFFKSVIEDKGGHRYFYANGKPIEREVDFQILFRLVWFGSPSDVGTEANDGRGPVDYKISQGAYDKTLVEMKLASNKKLKQNLEKQLEIYAKASDASSGIKAIVVFSEADQTRLDRILKELGMENDPNIVIIDARSDNKPSGSAA